MYQFESTPILRYTQTRVVVKKKVADILLNGEKIALEKTIFDEYVDNNKLRDKGFEVTWSE